jgi:thymidylate kinase
LLVDGAKLGEALSDVEKFVASSDDAGLEGASARWDLPQALTAEVIKVSLSLIAFRPSKRKGKFVVLSGVDKSGKETHCFNQSRLRGITSVYDHLVARGFAVFPVHQPAYDTLLGSLVGAHLGRRIGGLEVRGEVGSRYAWILWSLDRAQFNGRVDDWLSSGSRSVVLAKRWTESHAVYQPEVGVEYERVIRFERNVVKQDVTVVLDVSPAVALQRLKSRTDRDNYEHASLIKRVRDRYLRLSEIYPYGEVFLVDASRRLEEVNADILSLVDLVMRERGNE